MSKKVRFVYHNGVTQTKNLISHNIFELFIKPSKIAITDLEHILHDKKKNLSKEERFVIEKKIQGYKKFLAYYSDPWCTDKSPLGLSVHTGILELPEHQGGKKPIQVTFLT